MNGRQAYLDIAEELPDTPLAELDPASVKAAEAWAKKSKKKWPPKPTTSGLTVHILSFHLHPKEK